MATSIEHSLARILSWMENHVPVSPNLNPPAEPSAIDQVEAAIGMELPASFKSFLSLHNGESSGAPSLLGDFNHLLPCRKIIERYRRDQESIALADELECSTPACWKERVKKGVVFIKGPVKPLVIHPKWIPITDMYSETYRYIDLDPAPTGRVGQIIEFDPDVNSFEVIADSFEELLAQHAQRLMAGHFRFDVESEEIVSKRRQDPTEWGMPAWLKRV